MGYLYKQSRKDLKRIVIGLFLMMFLLWIFVYVSFVENDEFFKQSVEPFMNVSPNTDLKNGDFVVVEWKNIKNPSQDDTLTMLCDENLNQKHFNRQYKIFKTRGLNTYGKAKLKVYYHRSECIFFYVQKTRENEDMIIAKSNPFKFLYTQDEPMSIHISLTKNQDEMNIMWISGSKSPTNVYYGRKGRLNKNVISTVQTYSAQDMCEPIANTSIFVKPGYIHSAILKNLPEDTEIFYQISNKNTNTDSYSFRTRKKYSNYFSTSMIVFGDLSTDTYKDAYRTINSIHLLKNTTFPPDLVLHVGDISYARGRAYIWDIFGEMIQKIATYMPYMVTIGNHDHLYKNGQNNDPSGEKTNYLPYDNVNRGSGGECSVPMVKRFRMPDNGNLLFWYSYDYGLVHTIVLCSELKIDPTSRQYNWLVSDLKNIDRSKTPWVIVAMHRPVYSTEGGDYYVSKNIRKHIEPLLLQYKIDFFVNGHIHYYERTCSIRNGLCQKASKGEWSVPYLTIGTGGMTLAPITKNKAKWSIKILKSYGFGKFDFLNETYAKFYFYSSPDLKILDQETYNRV